MPAPRPSTPAGPDLSALGAITDAVEAGSGLPEIVRAAARALDASIVLADRGGAVLAVAARSPADEQSLQAGGDGVERIELRVADDLVGTVKLRGRDRDRPPPDALVRIVTTLIASEVERVGAPERASAQALEEFVHGVLERRIVDPEEIAAGAEELHLPLAGGFSVLVARAHPRVAPGESWRTRMLSVAERGARAVAASAVAVPSRRDDAAGEVVVLVPGDDDAASRTADAVLAELQSALPGCTCAVGRSRVAADPADLCRAGNEALLAANVTEGEEDGERRVLAFDDTGAYRLLLPAMSEDPAELQRFYAETVEPLVAYDEQYDTDLVTTVEAFLDCDGNVAGTAQRLFTHRHTIRYRLERVRDLSGLDVGSSDGREKLSLGLKAMRVLGIAYRGGPATEEGSTGGRVPRPG